MTIKRLENISKFLYLETDIILENKILLILLLILSVFSYAETDEELSQLYIDEAFYNYSNDNVFLAEEYLEKAMGFSDLLPEAWYLSGIIKEEQGNRLKSLDLYKRSIELGDEYTDFFYNLYYRYLNLLNITVHHKEVIDFYISNQEIFDHDNEIILKVSDSAFKYGLIDYSNELASLVYKRNPHNLKSLIYLLRSTGHEDFYTFIEKDVGKLQYDKFDEVLFQQLVLASTGSHKERLINLYNHIFGETPFYSLQLDRDDPSIINNRNLMIRSSGKDILEDGVYFGDYNFDGISDEIVSVIGDELTFLKDSNQDNITDLSINFTNNIPTNVFLNRGEVSYEFKYSDYPFVNEIHFNNQKLKRIYKIFPGTVYTPLKDLDSFNWKYNTNRESIVDEFNLTPVELLKMSFLFKEYLAESDTVFREYSLIEGEIVSIKEDTLNNGSFDHFLDIEAWQLESGKRDLNNDGIIDVYENYENGKLTGIAVDWNNNGKSEYLEDWSVLNIKTWDFNEDAFIDAEYISSFDGIEYNQVSVQEKSVYQYDTYSWDFSFENFWFNN